MPSYAERVMPINAPLKIAAKTYRPNVVKCCPVPIANASDRSATRTTFGKTLPTPSRSSRGA